MFDCTESLCNVVMRLFKHAKAMIPSKIRDMMPFIGDVVLLPRLEVRNIECFFVFSQVVFQHACVASVHLDCSLRFLHPSVRPVSRAQAECLF